MINLNSVSKQFGGTIAIDNLSLQINPGRFYALLGHNGAGKSTLLNIMANQDYLTLGSGEVFGHPLSSDLNKLKSDLVLVSEKIEYNIKTSAKIFFEMYKEFYPKWDQNVFNDLTIRQRLNLENEFCSFSRGQKMQLALIAAISANPRILLIDEITSVLDVYARKFFTKYLRKFSDRGGTVIMTTNIIDELENNATDIIIINKGKKIFQSDVQSVPQYLKKIRKTPENKDHNIFQHEKCFWSGKNSDGSNSYIIDANDVVDIDLEPIKDRRKITLNEMFHYFNELYLDLGLQVKQKAA